MSHENELEIERLKSELKELEQEAKSDFKELEQEAEIERIRERMAAYSYKMTYV